MTEKPEWSFWEKFPLVAVFWVDAAGSAKWVDLRLIQESLGLSQCRSEGRLLKQTKAYVFLAGDANMQQDIANTSIIPRGCIIEIKVLIPGTEAEEKKQP